MVEIFTIVGVVGSILCLLTYFLMERGLIKSSNPWYYVMNGSGALLILIACISQFDGGDLGAITQNLCWVMVSAMGVYRIIRAKRKERSEGF